MEPLAPRVRESKNLLNGLIETFWGSRRFQGTALKLLPSSESHKRHERQNPSEVGPFMRFV